MSANKWNPEGDPLGKEMIISLTAKSRPFWMSGENGHMTHSKITFTNLSHWMKKEDVLLNHRIYV